MNWQDYLLIGTVLFNLVAAARHTKLTKASLEKGLYNNRQLLGKILSDIVSEFTHQNVSTAVTALEEIVPEHATAHAQAGAHE